VRLALLLTLLAASAQWAQSQQLESGKILVATAKSHDPDFARSVVVLIRYDSESAIGLMLNKPTPVPIAEVLPEAKGKSVTVFAGGPVEIGVRGLLRRKGPPFFTVVSNKSELLTELSKLPASGELRIYAGSVGWTARQLQSEVARGLWTVTQPSAATLFDPHPETLWSRLTASRPIR
jgi:putative transcriptional regulator